jgi:hypothetical protein
MKSQAQMKELRLKLEALRQEIKLVRQEIKQVRQDVKLVSDNPHTVWTVESVLELNLTHAQRIKAELLAYKIFKSLYAAREPFKTSGINQYSNADVWIVTSSVKRVFDGVFCPSEDLLLNEVWTRCCAEVKFSSVISSVLSYVK